MFLSVPEAAVQGFTTMIILIFSQGLQTQASYQLPGLRASLCVCVYACVRVCLSEVRGEEGRQEGCFRCCSEILVLNCVEKNRSRYHLRERDDSSVRRNDGE